jgi:hypothetical protein
MGTYLIFIIPVLLLSMFVQWRFRNKFSKYAEMQLNSGLSGREVAEKMLKDSGIYDVKVLSLEGQLTDHYNPSTRTVNLSTDVYYGRSVAAAAVAAHECGHAVKDVGSGLRAGGLSPRPFDDLVDGAGQLVMDAREDGFLAGEVIVERWAGDPQPVRDLA